MKLLKSLIYSTALIPLVSFAFFHAGLYGGGGDGRRAVRAQITTFDELLNKIHIFIGWFQAIVFIAAIIWILYAALLFITKSYEDVKTPRTILIYAVVGIVVALLAYAVVPVICSIIGTGGQACEAVYQGGF